MKSLWSDADAAALVARYADQGIGEEVALRIYSSRLLGTDSRLVLHGGGNTSVKCEDTDLLGDRVPVLRIKGSGWDLGSLEPAGLPAVRLAPLLRTRTLPLLSDVDMLNLLRTSQLDADAPCPSVEVLLHAFLPGKFVDHTHARAVLALTAQPDGEALCRELFGRRAGIVPYFMSGLPLARAAAEVFAADPEVEGLILLRHGVFTFGATARQAYERMIGLVSLAEKRLDRGRKPPLLAAPVTPPLPLAEMAPVLRGALAENLGDGDWRRWLLDFRSSPEILSYVNAVELGRMAGAGVVTPDHVIRTKGWPLIALPPADGKIETFAQTLRSSLDEYAARYRAYFQRHNAGLPAAKIMLDPQPRVVLVPGMGLFGLGKSAAEAAIAADIAESALLTILDAEAIGRFESISEAELFAMEYWSLEQAKLGKSAEKPLARQVVLITGGAGTIGFATGQAFQREGAEVILVDLDGNAAVAAAARLGPHALGLGADVTCPEAVRAMFDRACQRFGGVDIVVSNAGIALQGRIGDLPEATLRKSFEINFFAHQTVSQNAVRVMRCQGTGGCLLYNVSKQAVNPGPDFGAYGLPKAATLFLARQYALDHGRDGIRANGVNADRIRGGMLTPEMIAKRSKARGLDERDYMAGNLLAREVTADDVAQAFVHQALALRTTASITTVDGGNIAAALR